MVNILIVLNSQLQHTPQHKTHSTQIQWRYRHHRCYPDQDGWWHEGWICSQCKSSQWKANQIYGRGRGYVHRIYFVVSLWLFVLYDIFFMFMIVVLDVSLLHHCLWVDCYWSSWLVKFTSRYIIHTLTSYVAPTYFLCHTYSFSLSLTHTHTPPLTLSHPLTPTHKLSITLSHTHTLSVLYRNGGPWTILPWAYG